MKLIKRKHWTDYHYVCDITTYLDSYIFDRQNENNFVYLLDLGYEDNKTYVIRLFGRSVGCVLVNDKDIIKKCVIYDSWIGDNGILQNDINIKLQRFEGQILKYNES